MAVEEITALQEQKLTKSLKKFLSDEIIGKGKSKETLAVFDSQLGMLPSCTSVHQSSERTCRQEDQGEA